MDIVASSIHDDTIRWFENGNINPTFSAATIATNADSVREITVADMDNDGDSISSASENDTQLPGMRMMERQIQHLLKLLLLPVLIIHLMCRLLI